MRFRREQGVNMFKFDGVAGNPTELAMEMEAMLRTLAQLRNQKSQKDDEEDVWINLTTGTWPSPFFLFWADSIWRGGPDIATRPKDWYGPLKISDRLAILEKRFVPPPLDAIGLDGLTGRQRWIRWRAMVVYILVVKRSTFFPLSQLMIHGVIVASHGDALHWGLSRYDRVDFTQEVWSFVAMGLQLQELYVAPRHMTPEAWDILAEALRWSRQHAAILRDSHWAFGDVSRYEVYCIASWDVQEAKGFLLFHNPQGLSSQSAPFSLDEVLELPKAQGQQIYQVSLVKTAFRPSEEAPSSPRLPGWNCTASFQSDDSSSCRLRSSKMVKITLQPTEARAEKSWCCLSVPEASPAADGLASQPSGLGLAAPGAAKRREFEAFPRSRRPRTGRLATVTATRRPERSSFTRRPSGGPPGTWKNTDGGPRVTADLGLELAGGLEDWLVGPATSVVRLEVRMEGLESLPQLSCLTQLRALVLSGNKIHGSLEALEHCPHLEELDLCQNSLTSLDGLRYLKYLSVLKATMNEISDAEDLAQLPNLRVVDLSKNRLTAVPLTAPVLAKLILYRNLLDSTGFLRALPSLIQLDLGRNKLTELDQISEWNPLLTKIFLYENRLASLPELHLPLLTDLW
ncbi:unnamed protein product, partial [Durusdinium trenchii]